MEAWLKTLTAFLTLVGTLVPLITILVKNHKSIQKSIDTLQETLNSHVQENEDAAAREARIRIIRFNDDLCDGRNHSESYFEDILEDIDMYEKYCATHPTFKNSRGGFAMKHIKETYEKLKLEGRFLN